jgi:hypothetical protein
LKRWKNILAQKTFKIFYFLFRQKVGFSLFERLIKSFHAKSAGSKVSKVWKNKLLNDYLNFLKR